nr:hypothetical protein [Acinetobacter sp. Marseille-Q1620]
MIFQWDFTRKTPVANLVALKFDLKEMLNQNNENMNKTLDKPKA